MFLIDVVVAKEARRLSKIVKAEGKVEKKALSVAINELGELQDLQKKAVKVGSMDFVSP
jgi:hypothetical protein